MRILKCIYKHSKSNEPNEWLHDDIQFDADFNGLRVSDWQIVAKFKFVTIFVKVKYAKQR